MEPKCPHCNENIDCIDVYDRTQYDDAIYNFVWGKCPKCKREYQWIEYYVFKEIQELKEIK